jgi:hypothetical protein
MGYSRYLLMLCAVVVAAIMLSGCTVTNEEGTGATEYWDAAYDYDHTVNTTLGSQGKLDKFVYEENIIADGEKLTYRVGGSYVGMLDTVIHGMEYNYTTGNSTVVVVGTVKCTVVEYNITRTRAENATDPFPAWYTVRIYRVYNASNDASYYGAEGYWAKYEAHDSNGSRYTWENPDAVEFNSDRTVYYEGTDNTVAHDEVIWHLYFSLWGGFWVNYGEGFKDGRKWGVTIAGVAGWSYSTDKTTYTAGSHVFNAWTAQSKWNSDEGSWVNKAVICTSLPIPLLFQWRVDDGGEITSFEYKLTEVSFK